MDFHPIANVFPLLEGEDFERFAADIGSIGLREPIVLFESKVLDGRNRLRACQSKGVEPRFTDYDGDDPTAYVVSKNLHRRHLSESQRALVAANLRSLNLDSAHGDTAKQAAELLGVSRASVFNAEKVLGQGAGPVVEAVRNGQVKVSDAAAVVDLPKKEQTEAVKKVRKGEAKTLREAAGKKHEGKATSDKAAQRIQRQNGKPLFDDRKIDNLYGQLLRAFDDRSRVFGKEGGYQDVNAEMEALLAAWRRWQKDTTGGRKSA